MLRPEGHGILSDLTDKLCNSKWENKVLGFLDVVNVCQSNGASDKSQSF